MPPASISRFKHRFLRTASHTLLVRYMPVLRRIYHSVPGRMVFQPPSPIAPLARRARNLFIRHNIGLHMLPALLRLGFTEKAAEELEEIASKSAVFAERLTASWELAVWFSFSPTHDMAEKSLKHIDFVLAHEKDKTRLNRACVLKAENLLRTGNNEQAYNHISQALKQHDTDDLYLALSNLYGQIQQNSRHTGEQHLHKRLELINKVLLRNDLETIVLKDPCQGLCPDNIDAPVSADALKWQKPLVSIIMPAFNAADQIHTALDSLLNQTWQNLEILVVDDASTDQTRKIVRSYTDRDKRVQIIANPENSGPYVARNLGLSRAAGRFVTCHDTDDWSHPRKIELQLNHLLNNPGTVANMSQQARVFNTMYFHLRGNAGYYTSMNLSSLMFRRTQVLEKTGYWDSVRFAGDSEFLRRLKKIFGNNSVSILDSGPVTFVRQTEDSLTGISHFGYPGYFMGARRAYLEAYTWWHTRTENPYMEFPLSSRHFPVPAPMQVSANKQDNSAPRRLDVVLATEFRLTGGTIASTIEEIKANQALGLKTGLMHLARFDLHPDTCWNGKLLERIDNKTVQLLAYGEKIYCDLLIIRHPPVLQEYQDYLPEIRARKILVIVNQSPLRDYGDPNSRLYDLNSCCKNLKRYFHRTGTWHPIGPAVRNALLQEPDADKTIELPAENWTNIINADQWRVEKLPCSNSKPVIGRHSRDQYVKWPCDKKELLAAYPESDDIEVQILGGAQAPKSVLGHIPSNWTVYPFDCLSPREFLAKIDVFVYFTHPDLVEAFGRCPLEAMAAGIPVILPAKFQPLFRDAAIYASPFEVKPIVMQLHQDQQYYKKQAEKGMHFVKNHFGYVMHRQRLARYVSGIQTGAN